MSKNNNTNSEVTMETASTSICLSEIFRSIYPQQISKKKNLRQMTPIMKCLGLLEGDLPRNKKEGVFNPNFITYLF